MDASPPADFRHRRFGDPAKFAPVVFVGFTILILYSVFMLSHCLPMLQIGAALGEDDGGSRRRAAAQAVFFHVVTAMVVVCYVLSIVVHPGGVPDTPEWELYPEVASVRKELVSWSQQETKKSGDRRHCKWCNKYKPDRCHHCRVCRMCILKMDHHCPWIYNCVGFRNYKYFFLLLLYCTIDLHFIAWSMGFSVFRVAMDPDVRFLHMCSILFGETLAVFLGCLVTAFFGFHTWLMISAMTTIEFCEKKMPKKGQSKGERSGPRSMYHLGAVANVRAALGGNLWAALLPLPPSLESDGLGFAGADTRLTSDLVACDARRLQTHRVAQRPQIGHSSLAGAPEQLWSHPNERATISILD